MVAFVVGGTEIEVGCVRVEEEADAAAGVGAGALAEGMLEFEDPFRRRSLRYLRGRYEYKGCYVRQGTNPVAFSYNIL